MIRALPKVMVVCGLLLPAGTAAMAQTQSGMCGEATKSSYFMQVSARTACPFSAVIENERTQTLADGTHIQTKFEVRLYRDSSGRIRYESHSLTDTDKDSSDQPNMIDIYDPVAGFIYFIVPNSGVAQRRAIRKASPGRMTAPQTQPAPKAEPGQKPVIEKLGVQEMEGISVTGVRITSTIPAGMEGNDRAITRVTENWNSLEMGITTLGKMSDPRSGDSVARMTSIEQSEPDASLFEVPADYTIKDQ
jgi:hypothetical protein